MLLLAMVLLLSLLFMKLWIFIPIYFSVFHREKNVEDRTMDNLFQTG